MGTFLFQNIIFGPVSSRRLGVSLGINLLPGGCKICNFNCIYCECGWTDPQEPNQTSFPGFKEFSLALETRLAEMKKGGKYPDAITFAGNGEPTLHPEFANIIEETIRLRNAYFSQAKIAVLTNGSRIDRPDIFDALHKIDQNIIKLDSGIPETINLINQPKTAFKLERLVDGLLKFNGSFIMQSLFFRGTYRNIRIDNTKPEEIEQWLSIIKKVKPEEVMVYTFHRDTPERGLERISQEELEKIARHVEKLGIQTRVTA